MMTSVLVEIGVRAVEWSGVGRLSMALPRDVILDMFSVMTVVLEMTEWETKY